MRACRLGVFGRNTTPRDGGADTLLRTIHGRLGELGAKAGFELVHIPWHEWTHRRRPVRYLWCRFVRFFGGELPLVNLNRICRRYALDAAWFAAPAYAHIELPFVYSLWDIGHRTIPSFPEMRNGRDSWTMREAQHRRMLGQATRVLVGNRTGATEAKNFFGVSNEKLVVAPFPNPDFTGVVPARPKWLGDFPYFLYPAQSWPHKNHLTLLHAMAGLRGEKGADVRLIFVGSDKGTTAHLQRVTAALGLQSRVVFAGFVSRGELRALYEGATALLFPSLLGPNNLPPQEAAVLGCPMVLSDLEGHREQMGEGALYADPLSAAAWAAAMSRFLHEPALRQTMCSRAKAAVASYTIEAYLETLHRALADVAAHARLWR